MENEQNPSMSVGDLSLMTSLEGNNQVISYHDLMIRRLKNRERQRRYRARKRLEADIKKTRTSQPLQYLKADRKTARTSPPLHKENKHVVSRRKKAITIEQFSLAQMEIPVNGTPQNFATRVHSQRDWKIDARRAHTPKEQEFRVNGPVIPAVTSFSGSRVQSFPSGIEVYPPLDKGCQSSSSTLDINEARRLVPGRRHWKGEARNKKS